MFRILLLTVSVLIASSVSGQQYSTERRYFDDFAGQKFCATRARNNLGSCCDNRLDECSVPIAGINWCPSLTANIVITLFYCSLGTLCYCDEFCDQHINPDCCPDYESFCKRIANPIIKVCKKKDGFIMKPYEEAKINCNTW